LWQAFTDFVNQNYKAPEYISLFVDENLKKGLKGVLTYPAHFS
jgi:cullin 3